MKKANNQMSREFDQFASSYNLTGQQMLIIDFLFNHQGEEVIQNQVEIEFNIRRSTTTAILQRMESHGLVERVQGKKDARQKVLHLTKKSEELVPKIKKFIMMHDDSIMSSLTIEEKLFIQKFLLGIIQHQGGEKNE
ncbi:MarR family winged helix-turn-helix transcriptional regulator [Lactococcus fujiensis]|uniref:MarR family winged helix-turn-helix transcriptional regulator n=1 Tax=Lactococcus fujiensis TaxID=610251 RepID=UPI00209295E3|nr:MarR family transcriptional regulator [Lactococcus fujiensis]